MKPKLLFIFLIAAVAAVAQEKYRPKIHFTPKAHWMNDPNGMVYHKGLYHLFYQYYPDSTVWGPMHWGHATTKDLVHWKHEPVALYPDSLGYIFSGSAVVDVNNTSGFGKNGKAPLVAIFTHHDPEGEKKGRSDYQNQSLAYSLDDGKTWTKYANNPVLKNPGIKDFRDPKVSWYEPAKKWILTLATLDRITFYSSRDLKNWKKESEFGEKFGAHGGVWECPDLFPLEHNGKQVWILFVSINPGGPNRGSATQYFTGDFDGKEFKPYATDIRWVDYGPDNYAGVTWFNTGKRKIFLGWMSNWQYAQVVPTEKWRSAMTIARDLSLEKIGDQYYLRSMPAKELNAFSSKPFVNTNLSAGNTHLLGDDKTFRIPMKIYLKTDAVEDFTIRLDNDVPMQYVSISYSKQKNEFTLNRSKSGNVSFEKTFAEVATAPRLSVKKEMDITLIIDESSIEIFADQGSTVMSAIFFADAPLTNLNLSSSVGNFKFSRVEISRLR